MTSSLIALTPGVACAQCPTGSVAIGANAYDHFVAVGSVLYLPGLDEGLLMFDVSNPASPVEIGRYDPEAEVMNVDVVGTTAYLLTSDDELVILDVGDHAKPTRLGSLNLGFTPEAVRVSGSVAFVTGDDLVSVDVSDPSQPVVLDTLGVDVGFHIKVSGTLAYTGYLGPIRIIDISNPNEMVLLSETRPRSNNGTVLNPVDIAIHGTDIVFTSQGRGREGIGVIDASDPEAPVVRDFLRVSSSMGHIAVSGTSAFVTTTDRGVTICIFDVSDPNAVRSLGARRGGDGNAHDVAVVGDWLYFTDSLGNLHGINIGPGCEPCLADVSTDGVLDESDLQAWVEEYNLRTVLADQNGDGQITPADFSAWIANFNAGCD